MNLKELNNIELEDLSKNIPASNVGEFVAIAGKEHYRLLHHLCKGKKLVFDVGTYKGVSSIAMSTANKVISYDVEVLKKVKKLKNITYKIGDAMEDELILKADLILLDTYHDGVYEQQFYKFLKANNYKGILVIDDIHYNREMLRFWSSIADTKEDLTEIGHYTGTGIVYFGKSPSRCKTCG